ncbi:MAG: hypothetical protein R3B96_08160 [Pirellulaceae bacterium]
MYGINMKLEEACGRRRVKLMEQAGIKFVTNTEIGRDIPARELVDKFDSVILCTGDSSP